jgi:type VI secretion system protein ImpG
VRANSGKLEGSMSEELYPYYQAELYFIRKLAQEFARKYPAAAARLQLEPDRSADPHVERLIESFALLTGRIQHKLHDEFPELTDAVLSVIYPHSLTPIPSFATIQFQPDPARATPEGVSIPAGSILHTDRVGDLFCQYKTCYPVQLWPLKIVSAKLHPPPFPQGLNPPARATAAIRIRVQVEGDVPFDQFSFDSLRLHLLGDHTLTAPFYDLLLNHALEVAFVSPEKPKAILVLPAEDTLKAVGLDPAEGLLPYPSNVFPGYRLLTEYFSYPAKFLYFDLCGWDAFRKNAGTIRQIEVVIFLDRSHPRLEQMLDAGMLRLGCTPVVNLFEWTAEPISLTHTRPEYKVIPEVGHPQAYEIYSIKGVTAASSDGKDTEYQPFYHFRHGESRDNSHAFWYSTRKPGLLADDRGTDVYLHLVDTNFDPTVAAGETVVVRTLCTNRDLPTQLPRIGEEVRFSLGFAAPGVRVRSVRNPTGSLRPANPRSRYWHLISHLNLNHLSLTGDESGTDAFKSLLRLYDLTDMAADPQTAALARNAIDGILRVSSKRTTGWIGAGELGGFARGLEVTVELDETKFVGASGVLFAMILERFFGLYASINSFTQLVARYRQRDGILKRWPPRAGDQFV